MSTLSSFYGQYVVTSTVGTPFGVTASIVVESDTSSSFQFVLTGVSVEENFSSEGSGAVVFFDTDTNSLVLSGVEQLGFFISLYRDPKNDNYRLLYGYNPTDQTLFVARYVQPPVIDGGYDSEGTVANAAELLLGSHRVSCTGGSQFGLGSTVDIEDDEGSLECTATITNGMDGRQLEPISGLIEDGVLHGEGQLVILNNPVPFRTEIACGSIEGDEGRSFIYGVTIVGDPQQAGTFGSDLTPTTPTEKAKYVSG